MTTSPYDAGAMDPPSFMCVICGGLAPCTKHMPNMAFPALCPCGQPLHYSSPEIKAEVDALIARLGPTVEVAVLDGKAFKVPRHYIALHGVKAQELPALAAKYGFKEIA